MTKAERVAWVEMIAGTHQGAIATSAGMLINGGDKVERWVSIYVDPRCPAKRRGAFVPGGPPVIRLRTHLAKLVSLPTLAAHLRKRCDRGVMEFICLHETGWEVAQLKFGPPASPVVPHELPNGQ